MSEMRGAAVSPRGWQDFTARKCRRRRQRNTTPREKTLNQTRAIVPTNFPKNIGAFPNLPQILELSQICFRIIRVSSRSPSFHILRFKRAPQLRPSHTRVRERSHIYSLQRKTRFFINLSMAKQSQMLNAFDKQQE